MMKLILSIFEGLIASTLIYSLGKIFIEIGGFEGYFGLFCFSLIIISSEIKSYNENKLGWLFYKLIGNHLD